ncbi:MAG TPA: TorF family putative porin [Gemmatimonadales bacterium]|nr:TorF family putative porin [Gemmatimonadales bacterium]
MRAESSATLVIASVAVVALLPAVRAQAPPPLSGSVALVGDYRFRGISQTYTQPAVQAGVEYDSKIGAYGGTWGSNVSGNQFLNGASLELDLYGGYKRTYGKLGLDLGAQYYWYPSARYNITPGDKYNTFEAYFSTHYGPLSAKYSHALTDLFGMKTNTIGGYCGLNSDGTPATSDCLGTGSTKGSGYVDLAAAFNVPVGMSLALHYGYQYVRNYAPLSYSDYKVALTRPFSGVTFGAALVGTNAEERFYRYTPTTAGSNETQDVSKPGFVLSASKAF